MIQGDLMFFTYLRRELTQRKRQTMLVGISLGISIGLIIVVNAASTGISDAQKTVLSGLYGIGTDISVTKNIQPTQDGRDFNFGPGNTDAAGGSALNQTRLAVPIFSGTFDQQTLTKIANTKGVAKTAATLKLNQIVFKGNIVGAGQDPTTPQDPTQQRRGFGGGNFNIDMTSIEGVDTSDSNVGPLSGVNIDKGRNFQASDANSTNALVDSTYALAQKIDIGGTVAINGTDFIVIGIISSASASPETSSNLYIPLDQAQSLSKNSGVVTNIYIAADSSSNTGEVQKAIETLIPDATVSSQTDLANNLSGSLSSASSLVNALSKWLAIIVLLVAFLIAILFTSSGVTRRIRELGTLKAIGWKTNRIVRQIMGESLITSFFGAIIGLILGIVGILVVNAVAPTLSASVARPGRFGGGVAPPGGGEFQPPAGGFGGQGTGFGRAAADAATLKLHIGTNLSTLVIAVVIAILGGLIAGSYGSWKASRLSPAEALRSVA
jgi:putative ABC transport system permease protein